MYWSLLLTNLVAPKGAVVFELQCSSLTAKTVQSTALAFQSVHHVHGGDSLALGVLGVRHSITDHVLQENFENTAGLFVNQPRDTLHTSTASKTTDGGLGDALDVVSQDFSVTLGASFS